LRLGRIDSPGLARVLDVVRGSSGGIVVAEWTNGRSLKDVADTVPPPVGAARAVRALAGAAEAAHRSGAVLALDHPDRIRISSTGNAVLAFPGIPAAADRQADVQGLGAVLYALITATWPLQASSDVDAATAETVGGMPAARRREDGSLTPARSMRAGVPYEISAVTERALQPQSGIRTAAAVHTVLDQASVQDQPTDLMAPVDSRRGTGPAPAESPLDYDAPTAEHPGGPARARGKGKGRRSGKMLLALGGLAVAAILVVAFLASQLAGSLGTSGGPQLPSLSRPGTSITPTPAPTTTSAPQPTPAGGPVVPTSVTVFSPQGTQDDPRGAGNAVDGDPSTSWATDRYLQQLPRLKTGVGLLLTLPEPTALSSVAIDSPSDGTVVEIRSSDTASPSLSDTTVLDTTTLSSGRSTVTLENMSPTRYLLVWITKLGGSSGSYSSKIAELTLQRAG
jgi:putative peptidoglycan lipid II flippase